MRVGFVGTENSHVADFIRFLNVEDRYPGHRAVALAGGHNHRNSELAEGTGIDIIVDEPADLIEYVDAAIVCNRDGSLHRAAAEPLLRAGLPVLVDKPLATTIEDATALLDAAQHSGSVMVSASALRFTPEVSQISPNDPTHGPLRHLHVAGPADRESEYGGLFFYGIHHVEAALEILGNPVVRPGEVTLLGECRSDTAWATTTIEGVTVTFTFVAPEERGQIPFHAASIHKRGIVASELTLGRDYNAPVLDTFFAAIKAGKSELTAEQLLSPVTVLDAISKFLEV